MRDENCLLKKSFGKACMLSQDLSQKVVWLPPLLTRMSLGILFLTTGWGKLTHIPKVIAFFTGLGIPAPQFHAYLVAFTEFGCGLLLLLGFMTRLAAVPLFVTMIVALVMAKKDEVKAIGDLFGLSEYLYIVLLIWL